MSSSSTLDVKDTKQSSSDDDESISVGGKGSSANVTGVNTGQSEASLFSEAPINDAAGFGHHVLPTNYQLVANEDYFKGLSRTRSIAFYLSLIGSAVGFGNVWRFPKEVQQGGGLAYLIIYVLCAAVFAYPLCTLEIIYGQFCRSSPFDGGLLAGTPKGIILGAGICGMVGLLTYYHILIVWVMMYLFKSISQPWYPDADERTYCAQFMNTADCNQYQCYFPYDQEYTCCTWNPKTDSCTADITGKSAEYFYNVQTYNNNDWFYSTGSVDGYGDGGWITRINWPQFGMHCLYCVLLLLATFGGRNLMNWVMYGTMLPAAVIVFALLIYTFTLEGASHGASVLLFGEDNRFQYEFLYDINIWKTAIFQVIVSMSLGAFVVPVLSAECPFTQTCGLDSIVVSCADMLFGIVSGFIIYGMMGFVADKVGGTVTEQASAGGASLIFVVYSAGLSSIDDAGPAAKAVHFMFWLMFFLLGFTSTVAIVTSLCEFLARTKIFKRMTNYRYSVYTGSLIFSVIVTVITLFGGFLNCSDMGPFMVDPLDTYTSSIILPGTIFLAGFIFLWCMRSDKQKNQVGTVIYHAMIAFLILCMIIAGSSRYFYPSHISGPLYAVFALILPVCSTPVFAGIITWRYGGNYCENFEKVFNGYFGTVLEHIAEVINHDKPRFMSGFVFPDLSGMMRWLAMPFLGAILIDTIMIHKFQRQITGVDPKTHKLIIDGGNYYPMWIDGIGLAFVLAYIILLGVGFTSPKSLKWFCDESSDVWNGLFRRDKYTFGFFKPKAEKMRSNSRDMSKADLDAMSRASVYEIERFAEKRKNRLQNEGNDMFD